MRVLLGLFVRGASYHTSSWAFHKKLDTYIQILEMQYKMIPHNIVECWWLIAGTKTPAG